MQPIHTSRRTVPQCGAAIVLAALIWCVPAPFAAAQAPSAPTTGPARASTQQPTGSEPARYWLDLAQVHQRYGMTDEAANCYPKALELAKTPQVKIQVLCNWGELLSKTGNYGAASDKYAEALALAEDVPAKCQIAKALATALDKAGKVEDAADQYEFLMENSERSSQRDWAQNAMFDLYNRIGKPEELERRFQSAVAKNPENLVALQALVKYYVEIKSDLPAARRAAMKIVTLKPDDPGPLIQLADLTARAKDIEGAVSLYEKVAGIAPALKLQCYDRICNAYMSADQKDKALAWAEKATTAEPQNAQVWAHFGEMCTRLGQPGQALPAYQKAVGLAQSDPERDELKLRLAGAYSTLKQDDQAIALLKELAENPKSPVQARAKRQLIELYDQRGMLNKVNVETTPVTPGK